MKFHLFFKRYLAALNQYKWAGLTSFACISALTSGMTTLLPKTETNYVAHGELVYRPIVGAASPTTTPPPAQASPPSPETLMSDQLLQRTSDTLKTSELTIAPNTLRDRLKLEKDPKQENRFLIRYSDSNAQQAKLAVESFTAAVSNQSLAEKRKEVEATLKLLEQRKRLLTNDLRVAEEKLREFSRREKPAVQAAVDGSLISAITNIQQQQRQLRQQLEGTNAELNSIQSQLGMSPAQAYVASALSADSTIANSTTKLAEIESQIKLQQRELLPKHPDMLALQQQQQVLQTQLQQRIAQITGSNQNISPIQTGVLLEVSSLDKARQDLANKLVNLQTQRNRLSQELGILSRSEPALRRNYTDGTALKLELEKLTKEVARDREAFDQTEKQLAAAELKKAETRSDWVNEAPPQVKDISNQFLSRPVFWLAGGVLGVIVAGATVLLLDVLRDKLLIPEEVQAILRQQVSFLGILPQILKQAKQQIPVLIQTDSPYLEAYELLRSSLLRHSRNQSLKTVVFSSTRNGEGKTTSAYNLAIASARAGKKTLLVEANLRAASQAQTLGVAAYQGKGSGALIEGMQIDQIQPVPDVKNLFVLPSLGCTEQVTEVLESSQTQQLLKQSRDEFDFVVIDATTLRFSDALLIEPFTDGLVLITRPGYTDRNSFKLVIEKLADSDVKLLGVVMNHVTTSMKSAHLLSL
ncbi:AAA family ATPase [Cyanobacteria bacterium FACHB-63]|nr:AAA family ATPase [Cyanobacteria bacterium FACHB-63]